MAIVPTDIGHCADSASVPNIVLILADDQGYNDVQLGDLENDVAENPDGGAAYPRWFEFAPAMDHEPGIARRDPSDVIRVGDAYYVWYSKVAKGPGVFRYPSGYSADVWFATSPDGHKWTEQGLAVGKGEAGDWDEHGVFTPNILVAGGKYYLFYTGVPRPFDDSTKTAIGLAVADSPAGPFAKLDANPVLLPSDDASDFDSMRVDDASLVARGGKFWFYYKGRQMGRTPSGTKMGVAIADSPKGPYKKHPLGPLHPGHEVLVWPQGTGVASLATSAGPRAVYFARDGLHFHLRNSIANHPQAPGIYRSDDFRQDSPGEGARWGISQANRGGDVYLARFDCRSDAPAIRLPFHAVPYDKAPPVGDLRFSFESGELDGWKVVHGKFDLTVSGRKALPRWQQFPFNKHGKYHLSTLETRTGTLFDDTLTGTIESPRFRLTGKDISLLIGGGDSPETYVALCTADGKEVMKAGGTNSPLMRRVRWNVADYIGQTVFLRVVDRKKQTWAHITLDDVSIAGTLVE